MGPPAIIYVCHFALFFNPSVINVSKVMIVSSVKRSFCCWPYQNYDNLVIKSWALEQQIKWSFPMVPIHFTLGYVYLEDYFCIWGEFLTISLFEQGDKRTKWKLEIAVFLMPLYKLAYIGRQCEKRCYGFWIFSFRS